MAVLCQLCLENVATRHVTERGRSGRFLGSDYCERCYQAKYATTTDAPTAFPRPRFTIRKLMILVACFAIPNCVVAAVMRSGLVHGTGEQLSEWSFYAFLGMNLYLGTIIAYFSLFYWLQRAAWHRRSGGVVPLPKPRRMSGRQLMRALAVGSLCMIWIVTTEFLTMWLTPRIWPIQRFSFTLFMLLMLLPLVLVTIVRRSAHAVLWHRVRQNWRGAGRAERFWMGTLLVWPIVLLLLPLIGPGGWPWRGPLWMTMAALVALVMGVPLMAMTGLALTTRRR